MEKFDVEDSKKLVQENIASGENGKWLSLNITSQSLFSTTSFTLTPQNFLRAGSFQNPGREIFREREMLIVEFIPNNSFMPVIEADKIVAKLSGRIWIDLSDKVIVGLEARAFDAAKNEKSKSGIVELTDEPVFIYDQIPFAENLWFPSFLLFDSSKNENLFWGINVSSVGILRLQKIYH